MRRRYATGQTPASVATNNTLVRASLLERTPDVRFSEALSLKGGSDTDYFDRIIARGARVVWCDEAEVVEEVPLERANARWLMRRAIRIGNVNARRAHAGHPLLLAGGVLRVVLGLGLLALGLLVRRTVSARAFNMVGHGIGMTGHVVGLEVVEYKRRPADG